MSPKYRQLRTQDRRREIVEAALACFAEYGLGATTIELVRARSAASTGSIYHHFRDKEGLAAEVYGHVLRAYHESLLELLANLEDGRPLIDGIVRHLVAWVNTHRQAAGFLVEMRNVEPVLSFDESIRKDTAEMFAAVTARLESSIRKDLIIELPRHLYPVLLVAPAMAMISRWVRGGMREDVTADADALADAAWRALEPH